nr:MAG TPA: hypothetical protein [Caudoviricetes sp.]
MNVPAVFLESKIYYVCWLSMNNSNCVDDY